MAEPITNVLGTVAIKHCGEYDATMHYEKLNVVTYNGSSYCAKNDTIGNLPTNTTYWDLMAEKGEKGDKGDTGEIAYSDVVDNLTSTETQKPLSANQGRVLSENILTNLVVVGDSYTALQASNWAELVASQLHLTLYKHGTSSMGYVQDVQDKTFIDNLSWGMSSDAKAKTKYVICYGGLNDLAQDKAQVKTNVKEFCEAAKEMFPNAQIIIVGPQSAINTINDKRYRYLINAIQEGALESSCSYVNAYDWLWNNQEGYSNTYDSDNTHPSALGYKIIASKMLSIINGLCINNNWINVTTPDTYTGNKRIELSVGKNSTHVTADIESITAGNAVYTRLLKIDSNIMPFISLHEPLAVYKTNQYNGYIIGLLGYAIANGQNNHFMLYNLSGSDYTGPVKVVGDIISNYINN